MVVEGMERLLVGPGIVLDGQHPEEDRNCGRPEEGHEEIVVSNSHLGLGHPGEDIEDVEIPAGLPFAPCSGICWCV